jgi:hypothetical protein
VNFSVIFDTDESKERLIQLYHKYKDKTDLYSKFLSAIKTEFDIDIDISEKERFRCWFKRVRRSMDEQYASQELKILELKEERVKARDQRRELNKIIREKARFDYIQEFIKEAAAQVAKEKPIVSNRLSPALAGNKEGVAHIGDWHFGLEYKNMFGEFNPSICRERVEIYTQKVIQYGLANRIKRLYVVNTGDLISGNLHVTVRIANTEDIIKQTMSVAEVLAEMLSKFAEVFDEVIYCDVLDNHARVTQNKNDSIPKESFVRVIKWWLETRLSDITNIKFIDAYDDEIAVLNICSNIVFAVHGHRDSIKDIVSNLTLMTKQIPDYVFIGHMHHHFEDEIHGCEIIMTSSLCGTDDYAKGIRKTGKPGQKFHVFSEHGREITYFINF